MVGTEISDDAAVYKLNEALASAPAPRGSAFHSPGQHALYSLFATIAHSSLDLYR